MGRRADFLNIGGVVFGSVARFCNAKCPKLFYINTRRPPEQTAALKLEHAFAVLIYHSNAHLQQIAWVLFLAFVVMDHVIFFDDHFGVFEVS